MNNDQGYEAVKRSAMQMLRNRPNPDFDTIRMVVGLAAQGVKITDDYDADVEAISRDVESILTITIGDARVLVDDDPRDHQAWLPDRRAAIDWKFWNRYRVYLEDEGWAPQIVTRLDGLTDRVLELLENPDRPGPWDRRGMVVGSVQSGKTAHYTGLINKAIDSGYKLIIVLAGVHNSLRSQTQLRVDEGVLGFDSKQSRRHDQARNRIGVGALPEHINKPLYFVHSLTNSEEAGDFNTRVARQTGIMIGNDPVVLVVKKQKTVLKNLIQWALSMNGTPDPRTGKKLIFNVPMLLIDDEADHASINTKAAAENEDPEDFDPTAINRKIREMLQAFDKSAYVGYTATPFANIFVNPEDRTVELGDDIFPRSFIMNLPVSTAYVGPQRVFGMDGDPDAGFPYSSPLPILRNLDDATYGCDYGTAFPQPHKKEHVPAALPPSLKEAIRAFILVCAARRARGQETKHNSMLIHVTRFKAVQDRLSEMVLEELDFLKRRIANGDGAGSSIINELKALWENDFEPTTAAMGEFKPEIVTWAQVEQELHAASAKIDIKTINGSVKDVLDYEDHEDTGRSVIAIGGDKLSRGLTLEGLSVSYYLRASKMYDTLMQMGRWFGYRPGYLDLCRLYTTEELIRWYRHITLAEQELRREFQYMFETDQTPVQYGLRVRAHPGGMIVTALNKMKHGQKMLLSYTGELVQTTHLFKDPAKVRKNFEITEEFLNSLPQPSGQTANDRSSKEARVWRNVSPDTIIDGFLMRFLAHPSALKTDGGRLADYIRKQVKAGDLTRWTVALISSRGVEAGKADIGPEKNVGLIRRGEDERRLSATTYAMRNSRIVNPPDEFLDLTQEECNRAFARTLELFREGKIKTKDDKEPEKPTGKMVREVRDDKQALLFLYPLDPKNPGLNDMDPDLDVPIFGYAISFPESENAIPVEYVVDKTYRNNMFAALGSDAGSDEDGEG
jgi:hypothetical protein